eukprot:7555626-Pyramimonas_sp.AAC.1
MLRSFKRGNASFRSNHAQTSRGGEGVCIAWTLPKHSSVHYGLLSCVNLKQLGLTGLTDATMLLQRYELSHSNQTCLRKASSLAKLKFKKALRKLLGACPLKFVNV